MPRKLLSKLQLEDAFEQHQAREDRFAAETTSTLKEQDRILRVLERKLDSPVLNGGFESLMQKVEKIETTQDQLQNAQKQQGEKIDLIHVALYDPEKGLYSRVKDVAVWVTRANWIIKGTLGLVAAASLTGMGKILYDLFSGHIKYSP